MSQYSFEVETFDRNRGHLVVCVPRPNRASRTLCRRLAGVAGAGAPPVVLVPGAQPPTVVGESWHYTTRSGKPVYHPSAYGRVGWSSLVYHASTRRVEVGADWRPSAQ